MKILYIYEKMPGVYQHYLHNLLKNIKSVLNVKVMAYNYEVAVDHSVKSYGFKDNFQRLLFKLGLSKFKSVDLKIMESYDVVHLQHSFLYPKVIPLLEMEKSPKVIITLRGGDTYMKPWLSELWRDFYHNYGNKVAAFITMSEHQKKYLTRWGVPEEKIHVIPISFGLTSDVQPKYPNQEVMKLVSAFRMTWEKNIEGTLRFAKQLKEQNIPFQYDIYGDGHDLSQLYYFIDRFDLHGYVYAKGKVDNDELKKRLIDYDFFVQLSFSEALPTTVLEAQSVGLPCVVSNSGGLPEAVKKNETALVGDFNELDILVGDTVNLWKNKELYFSYSKEAILNSHANFSTDKEVERLTSLYNELLKK